MKHLAFGTAIAAVLLTASQAWAADVPVRAVKAGPAYDPCSVARFAGLYYGGNIGATGYTAHRDDQDGFLTDNSGWTATDIAASAGVQIGYDWQSCNQVFGVVADWSWTNAETLTRDNPNAVGVNNSVRSRMQWYSTFRVRTGVAVDDALYYVTAGAAAARVKTNIAKLASGDDFTFSKTRWGLVGGVGAEYALGNNWSFTAEVLYMRFADQSVTFIDSGAATRSFDLNDSAIVARIGLNYRWGGTAPAHVPPLPVKAAAPVYTCGPARFQGGYVGGNVGVNNYTSNPNDLDGLLTDNGGWTQTDVAATAGVQAGYDWQSCNKVFGWVADFNWSNAETTVLDNPNAPDNNVFRSSMDWFGTLRARAGVAANDTLIYVTGGVAVARIGSSVADPPVAFSFEKTRWGLVGGVGAEFALGNNWSFNSEILYMHFAKHTATGFDGATPFQFDFADSAWIGRVGLNYRWGDPGPVATAGLPVKAPAMGYACGPARFQGGYVGGNVGGTHYTAARNDNDGFLTDNAGRTATDFAATAGVQAGYDWQSCNRVLGWVADVNWADASALTTDNADAPPAGTIRSSMDWYGTLRARAGLAANNALVYLTGGVAVARIGTTITDPPVTFDFDRTRWGFVGGAGAEFLLGNNWSFSTELLYMQFAKKSVTGLDGATPYAFDLNDSALVGRVGLNYRFSTADIPVQTRY